MLVQREKHQCVVLKVLTFTFHKFLYGVLFLDSSMVEHSAVNRVVVGSSPTRGVSVFTKKLYSRVLRDRDAYLLLEIADTGPLVKRLRHRPFTAVTRVRFPSESLHEQNMRHKKCATAYTGSVTTEYGDIAKW